MTDQKLQKGWDLQSEIQSLEESIAKTSSANAQFVFPARCSSKLNEEETILNNKIKDYALRTLGEALRKKKKEFASL